MEETVFTIGHSTHDAEVFVDLLALHGIAAVCDVRSAPYSRVNPQFNRETLKNSLREQGVKYVFLGRELGARSIDPDCYRDGRVQYDLLAKTELFRQGMERVLQGIKKYRVALMCAEKDPIDCHRTILVSRQLEGLGVMVRHILGDGRLESQAEAIGRLVRRLGLHEGDMFRPCDDPVEAAYRLQGERIAYASGKGDADPAGRVAG